MADYHNHPGKFNPNNFVNTAALIQARQNAYEQECDENRARLTARSELGINLAASGIAPFTLNAMRCSVEYMPISSDQGAASLN